MKPLRRQLMAAGLGLLAGMAGIAAADEETPRRKFIPIPAQPTEDSAHIEVREFFYYGCGACYAFEPHLRAWEDKLPADVMLVRTPALRNTRWVPLTVVWLVLRTLGVQQRLHQEVFDAYHFDNIDLGNRNAFIDWAAQRGLARDAVQSAWESDDTTKGLEQIHQLTRRYGVQSVPTLIVDGRYLTSPSLAGGQKEAIAQVEELIARRRAEHGKGEA